MLAASSSNTYRGAQLVLGAMAIIGLIDNFIRYIAEDGGVWQFYLLRALLTCTIVVSYLLYKNRTLMPVRFWAVALRSVLTAGAILLYFGSVSMIPIAEAGATLFSAPIFVLIFSVFIFRSRVGLWRILAVIVGFTGVVLVLRPDPSNLNIFTVIPAMAGMMYALGQLVTSHLCSEEDTVVVLLGFFVATAIFGLIGLIILTFIEVPQDWMNAAPFFFTGWVEPTGRYLFWTMVQGIGSLIAVAGLIRGYQIADPTFIAVYEYSFLVYAGFWGWILWNELPDILATVGIFAIVGAGIIIAIRSKQIQ